MDNPRAWSSGLSTNEFAACLKLGLKPLGFVQGCSVVSWNMYNSPFSTGLGGYSFQQRSGYSEQFNCPHGFVSAEHRLYGYNYEQTWAEQTWAEGFAAASQRLRSEAESLGAHGIIGIVDRIHHHGDTATMEFSLSGTAVGIDDVDRPAHPFATFVAGQKLNKLIEAGFVPVDIIMSAVNVGVFPSCMTEIQLSSGGTQSWFGTPSGEIHQLSRAHAAARSVARERVRAQLGGDVLHAAHLFVRSYESQSGPQIEVVMRGNRVRRFKDFEPIEPPRPVVQLVDR